MTPSRPASPLALAQPAPVQSVSEGRAPRVLRLTGITRRFGSLLANDSISVDLARGEVLALLGENGAGKSTLGSILFGHERADAGSVEAFGKPLPPGSPRAAMAAGIGLVHQHAALVDSLSVLDHVMLGTEPMWLPFSRRGRARQRLAEAGERFGLSLDPDAAVGSLSGLERQRVVILKALVRGARILVLDEPMALLTPQECQSLFATIAKLTEQELSIMFVTRKPDEALRVSQRIAVLRGGRLVATLATVDASRPMLSELMVGRPTPLPDRFAVRIGAAACQLNEASVVAPDGRRLLDRLSLTVHSGEVVAVAGAAGQGLQMLGELLCGLRSLSSGSVSVEGQPVDATPAAWTSAGVARIPADPEADGSIAELSLWENAVLERYASPGFMRRGLVDRAAMRSHARRLVDGYEVRGAEAEGVDTPAGSLSGADRQRFLLGRALVGDPKKAVLPRVIVALSPTRGLDVAAAAYVRQQLLVACEGGAAVLLLSDDFDEIFALADRVAVLHDGRLTDAQPLADWTLADLGLAMVGEKPTRSYVVDESNTVPSMFARVVDTRSGDLEASDVQMIDLGVLAQSADGRSFGPSPAHRPAAGGVDERPGAGHAT